MVPIGPSPQPQVASSSTALWATASKEWVIPAKPKPGRKPKKEVSVGPPTIGANDDEDGESTGRRVQNRAAQRAFRERKQTQLAELQARLQLYEQGEIERNIALQSIAKKMKEENEELRKENQSLKEKVMRLEQERDTQAEADRKRTREKMATISPRGSPERLGRKRTRTSAEPPNSTPGLSFPSYGSSISPMATSPNDDQSTSGYSTATLDSQSRHSAFTASSPMANMLCFQHDTNNSEPQEPMDYRCVLCAPEVPCVCREMSMQDVVNEGISDGSHLHGQDVMPESMSGNIEQSLPYGHPSSSSSTILDNLPAYQAPVPIRRRAPGPSLNPVFAVVSPPQAAVINCSGDPTNCMACANDSFGQAFCQAIGHSIASSSPCVDCPRHTNQTDQIVVGGCCGDISKCGSCGIAPMIPPSNPPRSSETIPTDDAWRQLKSHPNVAFADLSLLAEVVARRSKCSGSRMVVSPAPGNIPSEHTAPLHAEELSHTSRDMTTEDILLTDPHQNWRQRARRSPPPRLVPQEILIECGRRWMREVNADGVREALRLLDSKFTHTRP
ncbi:hypothetical protein BJ138DRAFT_1084581 [Hygrophoropsis aurantiaca]|uniref:Uncharacterized protein n=1 Tax=Hygrophoropsis aurantiaca TaxID=72124 RepID=A0ACB8AFB5_9AGAM|nr:hypothetical protein BJ138DRAFT_1084581 [Hygrophoropsis aurantiaca]